TMNVVSPARIHAPCFTAPSVTASPSSVVPATLERSRKRQRAPSHASSKCTPASRGSCAITRSARSVRPTRSAPPGAITAFVDARAPVRPPPTARPPPLIAPLSPLLRDARLAHVVGLGPLRLDDDGRDRILGRLGRRADALARGAAAVDLHERAHDR